MNRVLEPTTIELKKDEISKTQLLDRQFLFTKDADILYIKYNDKLIPLGGSIKQNRLEAGDNIEIIREDSEGNDVFPEEVRLLDNIDINTAELGKSSDTLRWKGTVKLGELVDYQQLFPITKYTDVGESVENKAILGGEVLVKMLFDDESVDYFHGAITLSSTGSWSLKGAANTVSNVRMVRLRRKSDDTIFYGLKLPAGTLKKIETSQEKHVIDNLYEEEETYTETETSGVQTEYTDDYFIGSGRTATTTHYDDRNYLALSNNNTGTAVVLKDTGIVPESAVSSNCHWQYCSISDLIKLRGEDIYDNDTNIYEYVTNGYYLYLNVYFKNTGGDTSSATINVAILDCYVCNTSGAFDPSLEENSDKVVEHIVGDTNWFNLDENLKSLTIDTSEASTNSYTINLYRSGTYTFYLTSSSFSIQLTATSMSNGYNCWYYASLDTLLDNLNTTTLGTLADFKDKGYYIYFYIYRRNNNSVRIIQVAITDRVMSTTPSNGTTGVIKNYGVSSQDWLEFNPSIVTNKSYGTLAVSSSTTLMTFKDTYTVETIESTVLSSANSFVTSFGDFKFTTTAVKEHEVEKTRTVPKISQAVVWEDVNYSSYWEDIYLTRTDGTTFSLTNGSNSVVLTQTSQSIGYNYWYYASLDSVIDLVNTVSDLEDDNLTAWYGKGYYIYLRIYRRTDNYDVRITDISITSGIVEGEPADSSVLVKDLKTDDQDWLELNAVIVTARSGYYYSMSYNTNIVVFSITQKGKRFTITEKKFKSAEFWFNGWKQIPDSLVPSDYTDDDFEYVVLSDKSNDNDSFAETFYLDTSEVSSKLEILQDTGEDNAPYKFIVSGVLSLTQLQQIADLCRDPDRQVYLDLSNTRVDETAEEWSEELFKGCVSLRGLIIPQGVKKITGCAFIWCTYLRYIDLIPSAGTLTSIGASGDWGTSVGFLTSTRVRNLVVPASATTIQNYLIGSSNIRNLVFLHELNNSLIINQWAFMIFNSSGTIQDTVPDSFHVFVTSSWYNGFMKSNWWNTNASLGYQWNNSSGWWTPTMVNTLVVFEPDWDQDAWQTFNDEYSWGESFINEVRSYFGYSDAIEIKDKSVS